MEKLNEVLIERGYVCTIIDIFTMKGTWVWIDIKIMP